MRKAIKLLFILLLTQPVIAQENKANTQLSQEELAGYEKQARQLVSFMEFAFNTLGSDKSEYKDKHTIIEQSYLKFFKDAKVQIEDDLVEKRDVVTNKDVQAYLKDIDFFFKSATFKYTIEEVSQEVNEAGDLFFKIKASRNLKGKTIENKELNDNRLRYIEINLDQSTQNLKIVSVYTTKSNEEQELIAWWNDLSRAWRTYFAGESKLNDSVYFRDIAFIHNDYIVKEIYFTGYSDTLIDTDTITINESKVLPEVRRIIRNDEIDISSIQGIYDLKPLYAFTNLKHLNISNAKVPDLNPIRNLLKLETIIASRSLIDDLEPLRYIPQLRILDVSGTLVRDLNPLEAIATLEELNVAESRVIKTDILRNLTNLKYLNLSRISADSLKLASISQLISLEVLELSGLPVDSLSFISPLTNLRRLKLDETPLTSLSGIEGLSSLEVVFLDNTQVTSLEPLKSTPALKMVYCDRSNIDAKQALAFMQARPNVKVIYESQELMSWWEKLPNYWKDIFRQVTELSTPPTREELHEVSFIKNLDLSNNGLIMDIKPLSELASIRDINISGTGVKEISPLSTLFDLQSLNISHTRISDLSPLANLSALTEIDFSSSAVTSLKPLVQLSNLRTIGMDSTNVTDVELLAKVKHLNVVYADGVPAFLNHVTSIQDSIPDALLIYQTKDLIDWWSGLAPVWKDIFISYEPVSQLPDRMQLHKIASLKEIDISNRKEVNNLAPLSTLRQLQVIKASNLQLSDILPLRMISRLQVVDIANTPISDITPLKDHKYLTELNCANSPVSDLSPLEWHQFLRKLDISGTQVSKLDALQTCTLLEELNCFNTRINSLKPIEPLRSLKIIRAYNTRLSDRKIERFKEVNPHTEIIFY